MRMGKALPPYRNKRAGNNSCFITIPQAILRENNLPGNQVTLYHGVALIIIVHTSNESRAIETPISEELIRASYGCH
jgi:hypothetical protein